MENIINLFRSQELNAFIKKNDADFEAVIANLTDDEVEHKSSYNDVDYLVQRYSISIPVLNKKNTQVHMSSEKISGYQFPSGTSFVPGQMYDIETARYILPFGGIGIMFFMKTNNNSLHSFTNNSMIKRLSIQDNKLIIEITNWDKITGKEDAVEIIKNIFLGIVAAIEENLIVLKPEVDNYNSSIRQKMEAALSKRTEALKQKKSTKNSLNPFS